MAIKTARRKIASNHRIRSSGRGRPRMESQKREPNSHIARSAKRRVASTSFLGFSSAPYLSDPIEVALNARARHFGLSVNDAGTQMAATYLGRMCLNNHINHQQYDAAQQFLLLRYHYIKSLQSLTTPLPKEEEKAHTNFCRQAKAQYFAALLIAEMVQKERPHGKTIEALQYLVIDDRELPYLLGDCRILLNRFHHHFTSP